MPASERRREIKRRWHRREKLAKLKKKAEKANASEKKVIADQIRALTPGHQDIIKNLGLEER